MRDRSRDRGGEDDSGDDEHPKADLDLAEHCEREVETSVEEDHRDPEREQELGAEGVEGHIDHVQHRAAEDRAEEDKHEDLGYAQQAGDQAGCHCRAQEEAQGEENLLGHQILSSRLGLSGFLLGGSHGPMGAPSSASLATSPAVTSSRRTTMPAPRATVIRTRLASSRASSKASSALVASSVSFLARFSAVSAIASNRCSSGPRKMRLVSAAFPARSSR